ncbi:hypothetical protein Slala05_23290 [Streptomyces lavendulae subsp. lavendulae]|nr:hypothetical protein Slala05_23290 [Streptomyces lavendulae subsp. lavendulae]
MPGMGLTEQLGHPDPRQREAAARRVALRVWEPEAEEAIGAALVRAAGAETEPGALAAQLDALPAVEAGLTDGDLHRLGLVRSDSPVLARLLARAGRLQISAPVRPSGAATLAVVRCLRGAPRTGLWLRTPDGAWTVLERIELYGRAADRLDSGCTGRVLLSGPGARGLGEWERLDADPRPRECVRGLRAPDPRVRALAAAGAADAAGAAGMGGAGGAAGTGGAAAPVVDPEAGRMLCAALARAAVAETDPAALESELAALLGLAPFLGPPHLALLHALDAATLPARPRTYLDALLRPGRTG